LLNLEEARKLLIEVKAEQYSIFRIKKVIQQPMLLLVLVDFVVPF
jgi:hypothetical protein